MRYSDPQATTNYRQQGTRCGKREGHTILPMCTTTAYRRYIHFSSFVFCDFPFDLRLLVFPSPKSSFLGARYGAKSKCSGNATNSSIFLNPEEKDKTGIFDVCWNRFRCTTRIGGGVATR